MEVKSVETWKPHRTIWGNRCTILGGDTFLYMLEMCKMLWLGGRFGGGKTAGAYIIASWLYGNRKVDRIMSNIPDRVSSPIESPIFKTAIIIDESWQFLAGWDDVKAYAAYLRKLEIILLMPSVFPPNPRLRMLMCYRIWDGYTVGLPFWVYKYEMSLHGVKEKGLFWIVNPAAVFGLFDTKFIPGSDCGIVEAIQQTAVLRGLQNEKKPTAAKRKVSKTETALENVSTALDDSATGFAAAAAAVQDRIRKR